MSDTAELDRVIEVGTALLGIPIQPEWTDAIRFHLDMSLAHAANVRDFTLPDEAEPAVIFLA